MSRKANLTSGNRIVSKNRPTWGRQGQIIQINGSGASKRYKVSWDNGGESEEATRGITNLEIFATLHTPKSISRSFQLHTTISSSQSMQDPENSESDSDSDEVSSENDEEEQELT